MTIKNIKITYDYQIFNGQRYGGISRYFFKLANNIAQRDGVGASVFSPIYINSYLSQASEDLEVIGCKLPVIKGSWRLYKYFNKKFSPTKLASLQPDIVHETYYASIRSGSKKSRTVVTVYDMIHELFPSSFLKSDDTSYLKAKAVERADHVICISRKTQSDLIKIFKHQP